MVWQHTLVQDSAAAGGLGFSWPSSPWSWEPAADVPGFSHDQGRSWGSVWVEVLGV
jgi:hypothetical protein